MARFALALLTTLLLAGCSRWQYQLGQPLAHTGFTRGDALADVLAALGPPQRIAASEGNYLLAWEFWRIREDSIGVSLGTVGADLLAFDWGGARISGEYLLLSFDRERRLLDTALTRFDNDVGGGIAVQPAFVAPDLTNVDELISRMPQHDWGGAWLLRLPQSLNLPADPALGGRAIEQRGTPGRIGQRTLQQP